MKGRQRLLCQLSVHLRVPTIRKNSCPYRSSGEREMRLLVLKAWVLLMVDKMTTLETDMGRYSWVPGLPLSDPAGLPYALSPSAL